MSTSLISVARWKDRWVEGACEPADYKCMNRRGLLLINEIRDGASVPALKMGTEAMLNNAMDHSKNLAAKGKLEHQKLDFRLCGSHIMGENVSQNHIFLAPKSGPSDPTKMCIVQFKNSPGHYANMISQRFTHFVMGVFVTEDGYIWCTQTFWVKVKYGKGKCARAS